MEFDPSIAAVIISTLVFAYGVFRPRLDEVYRNVHRRSRDLKSDNKRLRSQLKACRKALRKLT